MTDTYKHFLQDMSSKLNYANVVFLRKTGEVLAFHDSMITRQPKKASLDFNLDTLPKENSKVFYGLNLTLDSSVIICSGSIHRIDVEGDEIVIVFYDSVISRFKDNMLPRILWKDVNCRYLGHSEYVPYENNLQQSMVGHSDDELFDQAKREHFRHTDEAILTKEVCFFDIMGSIKVHSFTSMIKYHKFPYYSLDGKLLGMILVYTAVNETASLNASGPEFTINEIQSIINESLSKSDILLAIQNAKTQKVEYISETINRLGYQMSDFLEGNIRLRNVIHPEDLQNYVLSLEKHLANEKSAFDLKLRLLNTDGEPTWVQMRILPIKNQYMEVIANVMVMKYLDSQSDMEIQNKELLSLMNKGHLVYALRDPLKPSEFLSLSENFQQFGYKKEELLSHRVRFDEIIAKEDLPAFEQALSQLAKGFMRQTSVSYKIQSKRHEWYYVEERLYWSEKDGIAKIESVIKNVTSSKRAMDDLCKMNQMIDKLHVSENDRQLFELHFMHVLDSLEIRNQIDECKKDTGLDLAFFTNANEFIANLSSNPESAEFLLKEFISENQDFRSPICQDVPNLFIKGLPLSHRGFRIGTILLYGIIDEIESIGSYLDVDLRFGHVSLNSLDDSVVIGQRFADNTASLIYTTSLALYQIQISSIDKRDLSTVREKHELLLDILDISLTVQDEYAFFDAILPKIAEAFHLSRASYFVFDEDTEMFSCKKEWYLNIDQPHISEYQFVKKDDTFFSQWNLYQDNSFVINYEDDYQEKKNFRKNAKALIGVRVYYQERLFGILNFVDNHSMRHFSEDDIYLLEDIGYIFSFIADKTNKQKIIESSQKQIFELLDTLPNAVALFDDASEEIVHANPSFKKVFQHHFQDSANLIPNLKSRFFVPFQDKQSVEIYLEENDRWYIAEKTKISFEDDKSHCMMALTDITLNKKNAEMMQTLAFKDMLTGLETRVKFERDLSEMYSQTQASFVNSFIGILNIDNFKLVNNTFSYTYGDALIKEIARKLSQIPEIFGSVYRFSGNEFSFIVRKTHGELVYEVCNKVMSIFEKPFLVEGYETYLSVSLGIGFLTDTDRDVNDLIKKANLSLAEAKNSGKNKFVLYDVSLQKYQEDTLLLERALRNAIDENFKEFEVYYQPILSAKTSEIVSAEALIRWFSKDFGYVPPVKFIPIAEASGLIIPLGKHILNMAAKEVRKWLDFGHDISVSVNFSVIQTLQSDLVSTIISALHTYRVPPKNLTMEITESLAMKDVNKVSAILASVRQIGVKIAMDDFGTGYSSLSHLRKLPLDVVKIDRSFVLNLEFDPYYYSFIETIANFCHLNNTTVCCEGVENENQRGLLRKSNIDTMQGYLFSKPVPGSEFYRLLSTKKTL